MSQERGARGYWLGTSCGETTFDVGEDCVTTEKLNRQADVAQLSPALLSLWAG